MKVVIETERLILREFVEDDAAALLELNSDLEVVRFTPDKGFADLEEARRVLVEHPISDYRKYGFGRLACILKATNENIGFAGLKYLEELHEVEVGYRLKRSMWGQGYATEGARASVLYGFEKLALKSMIGIVVPENVRSVRVLEKAGLRHYETLVFRELKALKYVIGDGCPVEITPYNGR